MSQAAAIESLFKSIQEATLPGVWSKGVALSRETPIRTDSRTEEEVILRIQLPNKPISPKVTLWIEDEDWYCDCGDRNDPCLHIVAAVVALKTGIVEKHAEKTTGSAAAHLSYCFTRQDGSLSFDRYIVRGEKEERLNGTLVAFSGGITSGRIQAPPVPATREDYAIDQILNERPRGILDHATLTRLIAALKGMPEVHLDGKRIQTSSQTVSLAARIVDDGPGFRIQRVNDPTVTETFRNGAALCGDTLRAIHDPQLTPDERELLSGEGRFFALRDAGTLVSEVLPQLEKKIRVEIQAQRIPRTRALPPRIQLKLEKLGEQTLAVIPEIVYGDPPIARIEGTRLESLSPSELPLRDPQAERQLARKVQQELQLQPGQLSKFEGESAVNFKLKLEGWKQIGSGVEAFALKPLLQPRIQVGADGRFEVEFASPAERGSALRADPRAVFRAWEEGRSFVPLLGGGWAPLPRDWFSRYAERILDLLEARDAGEKVPTCLLPSVADLCDELHQGYPESLKKLKETIDHFERIPVAPLPEDLRAELRSYQRSGVNWLSFLRETGMGAMLADDMGLGKTLQALCAIRGKTLIVAPTSVLSSWEGQIKKFRPGLRVNTYYGSGRKLVDSADITLTSYGLLRLDQSTLSAREWDSIILDEAQTIKNPDSQVARAAHQLRGAFRIALSGTPVENRMDDLWSQFHFLNPGLLGDRSDFQDRYSSAVARGDSRAAQELRQRIKPFLLRRMKREVAPELPPRTETVLHCELNEAELDIYESIHAATRDEVLKLLESGHGVMAALEALLRMRQACCHPALVPGQTAATSSKTELLLETLRESVDLGHRALIFSQWTSYLDLLEPALTKSGITYSRLDGSTRDRASVVDAFQDPKGPQAMLISLKAGGVGLTLTAADHIFILDPWWNPAVEDQAADRAHRIGQTNPVLIHRLVAKNTVEDKILELQKQKQEMAAAVLSDGAQALSLTRDDLMRLLL